MIEEHAIASLRAKHAELERNIEEEEGRPLPDSLAIARLKKQKLRIKDEIARLDAHA